MVGKRIVGKRGYTHDSDRCNYPEMCRRVGRWWAQPSSNERWWGRPSSDTKRWWPPWDDHLQIVLINSTPLWCQVNFIFKCDGGTTIFKWETVGSTIFRCDVKSTSNLQMWDGGTAILNSSLQRSLLCRAVEMWCQLQLQMWCLPSSWRPTYYHRARRWWAQPSSNERRDDHLQMWCQVNLKCDVPPILLTTYLLPPASLITPFCPSLEIPDDLLSFRLPLVVMEKSVSTICNGKASCWKAI